MAWTLTTLTSAIQDYVESSEATMVSMIPQFIRTTERTIVKASKLPEFKKNVEGSMTASNRFLTLPSDCLAVYGLAITDAPGYHYLQVTDQTFIYAAYPTIADEALPKYYAVFDDNTVLLGPVPDSNYSAELSYLHLPSSLADAGGGGSTWLSTNAENAMLYGCLLEAYTFLKGEADLMQTYQQRFATEIALLKNEGEAYATTDDFQSGAKREERK